MQKEFNSIREMKRYFDRLDWNLEDCKTCFHAWQPFGRNYAIITIHPSRPVLYAHYHILRTFQRSH